MVQMDWSEAENAPLPDSGPSPGLARSERKRVRTLTTSTCGPGPDISERMAKRLSLYLFLILGGMPVSTVTDRTPAFRLSPSLSIIMVDG